MGVGGLIAILVLAGFVAWGVAILRSRRIERSTEASSHHESGHGMVGGGSTNDGGGGGD